MAGRRSWLRLLVYRALGEEVGGHAVATRRFRGISHMNIRLHDEAETVRIGLEGRFTFNERLVFASATTTALAFEAPRVLVDLRRITYMDSSALGMLLMLRDKAQVARKTVSLACAPGTVRDIINVAKFEKLFELE
jgi:anti-anti-sigma factor